MNYRPQGFTLLPPVIKNLLIINFLMYLGTTVFSGMGLNLVKWLALYFPASPNFMPHQLVTHMFMHGGFGHVFFNMFALWIFGTALENLWGSKRFLIFYIVTGLGASLVHMGVNAFQYYDAIDHLTPEMMELVEQKGYSYMMQGKVFTQFIHGALQRNAQCAHTGRFRRCIWHSFGFWYDFSKSIHLRVLPPAHKGKMVCDHLRSFRVI
jgi:membrane associated rhomboid family serine protease